MKKNTLVLLRHGESQWNKENRFTGWTDIALTKKGIIEAQSAGKIIEKEQIKFDIIFTSLLKRANDTMNLCIKKTSLVNIKTIYDWRLNERHYGALQGLNKAETALKYGNEQVHKWRRSSDIRPPALNLSDKRHSKYDKKYNHLSPNEIPTTECLKDTYKRLIPFWENDIGPQILSGKKVFIVAHGNSLRALIKHLDKVSDNEIVNLNIPTGIPLLYELDEKLNPVTHYYLGNQNIVNNKIQKVVNQGKAI